MKASTGTRSTYILLALLLFPIAQASANSGRAFDISGTAAINDEMLTVDSVIKEGDVIKTGDASTVKVLMKDRTVLDIRENSRFKLDKYQFNENNPDEGSSTFNLLKGTFRYISGLMAKRRHQSVNIVTGGATMGIRGSFDTISFDGTTISVDTSIGEATITFPDGQTMTITSGNTGTFNITTSQYSVTPTSTPDPVYQAASAIAQDPGNAETASAALDGLGDADATLVMAALINNASQLGIDDTGTMIDFVTSEQNLVFTGTGEPGSTMIIEVNDEVVGQTVVDSNGNWTFDYTDKTLADGMTYKVDAVATDAAGNISTETQNITIDTNGPSVTSINITDGTNVLASILGSAVSANPSIAVALAYVSSALSPANSQTFIDAIKAAAPDQAQAIQSAGDQGTNLKPVPPSTQGLEPGAGSTPGTEGVGGGGGGGGGGVASPS